MVAAVVGRAHVRCEISPVTPQMGAYARGVFRQCPGITGGSLGSCPVHLHVEGGQHARHWRAINLKNLGRCARPPRLQRRTTDGQGRPGRPGIRQAFDAFVPFARLDDAWAGSVAITGILKERVRGTSAGDGVADHPATACAELGSRGGSRSEGMPAPLSTPDPIHLHGPLYPHPWWVLKRVLVKRC